MMIVWLFLLMTVLKDATLLKIPPKSLSFPKPIALPIPNNSICMGDKNCPDGYICDLGSNSDLIGSCVPGKA